MPTHEPGTRALLAASLAQGMPPIQVARLLGHANDTLVRTLYAGHLVDEAETWIAEAASRLG